MAKATINPGVCGFTSIVEATSDGDKAVVISVDCDCPSITAMMEELGNTFNAYELILTQPGTNPLYQYASEKLPVHGGCITIAGITKVAEAACGLALPRDASITFER